MAFLLVMSMSGLQIPLDRHLTTTTFILQMQLNLFHLPPRIDKHASSLHTLKFDILTAGISRDVSMRYSLGILWH
jgi:hypothetical protein